MPANDIVSALPDLVQADAADAYAAKTMLEQGLPERGC